jgi:hypothetical protein
MSHVPAEAVLLALLGRAQRKIRGPSPANGDGDTAAGPQAAARDAHATSGPGARAIRTVSCDDPFAIHDAAALREGNLSPDGIRRLANHVVQCDSCKILIAALVVEAQRAESTGNHLAPQSAAGKK